MAAVDRNNPKRAKSSESTYTVMDLEREFPDDATCLDWLWRSHYAADGEHTECPKCGQVRKFHRVASRPSYSCDTCGQHVHPTAGTIFHKSSTSLALWFKAVFLMSSTRCGVSAKHLERELGVTYKTAWRMFHLIRNMLMVDDDGPLDGEVEMDETFVGGKPRAADRARLKRLPSWQRQKAVAQRTVERKTTVFGMVERGGRVRAEVVPSRTTSVLMQDIEQKVLPSAVVFTDELASYNPLADKGYVHHRIHHAEKVYVSGNVHTNTIEGFWSLVKNGLRGTYHAVSAKHLQGYLNEYTWRYNHRDDTRPMFLTLLANI